MTISPAQRRDAAEHPIPKGIQDMINRLDVGWRHAVVHGAGHVLRKPTDPNTRRQVETLVPVRSASLRARHADGRALIGIWLAEHQPEHWAVRKATKTMGERSAFVPARWAYSYEQGFVWTLCQDPACPQAGHEHPRAIPRIVTASDMTALLTWREPVVQLPAPVLAVAA